MTAAVRPASMRDRETLRRALPVYLSELKAFGDIDCDYPFFSAYWVGAADRRPYLIEHDGRFAGFALVNAWSPSGRGTDAAMAEFYVAPHARRNGVGLGAARAILHAHPGLWELNVMPLNAPAQRFWPRAIAAAGARNPERLDVDGETVHRFVIPPAACR